MLDGPILQCKSSAGVTTVIKETIALHRDALHGVLDWSRSRDYLGYNKHDGLNSPLLQTLLGFSKWSRILAVQLVMRSPINIRPLLAVKRVYNPKGLALFVQSWLDIHRMDSSGSALSEARGLLQILESLQARSESGHSAWGYLYPWQDPGFFAPAGTPNAVVTAFVCEAFLDAYEITRNSSYIEIVRSSISFFLQDLHSLTDSESELCLSYMPTSIPMRMRVMDVSILIGSVIARHCALSGDTTNLPTARRLVDYVVARQTSEGAWFYTDPPEDSRIRHDNYHTGFILDALWRYMQATGDMRYERQYALGLDFYRTHLFNADGSPRWMSDKDFPHDVHGAAQGILTFSRHQQQFPGFAATIADWAITHLQHSSGRFHYQKTRFYTKRFTLMRWCNAWMARALARIALTETRYEKPR